MKERNEHTSKAVGHIAARFFGLPATLNKCVLVPMRPEQLAGLQRVCDGRYQSIGTVAELKSVAASATNQSPDKKPRKA